MKKFKVNVKYCTHYSLDSKDNYYHYYECTIIRKNATEALIFLFKKFNSLKTFYSGGGSLWMNQHILDSYSIKETGEYND